MKTLNKKQLAFILDIKVEDARAKMCNAWEKSKGIEKSGFQKEFVTGAERNEKDKIVDKYPDNMEIEMLATQLNLPYLQQAVDDITQNYLTRSGTKRFILVDFPQKEIRLQTEKGKATILKIPPILRTMLPDETQAAIKEYWSKNYSGKTITIAQ